jgi:hypothetical protein
MLPLKSSIEISLIIEAFMAPYKMSPFYFFAAVN